MENVLGGSSVKGPRFVDQKTLGPNVPPLTHCRGMAHCPDIGYAQTSQPRRPHVPTLTPSYMSWVMRWISQICMIG